MLKNTGKDVIQKKKKKEKIHDRYLKIKSQNVTERENAVTGPTQFWSLEASVVDSICSFKSLDLADTLLYGSRTLNLHCCRKSWHPIVEKKETARKL